MAQPLFASLEEQYRLPSGLLDSVWAAESSRGQNMLSPKGAKGHFGFMDPTAAQYGVADPNDLPQAAAGAAKMYRDMIDQTGSLDNALAAYNWGIGNLQRKGIERAPDETRGYIEKVKAGMAQDNDPWNALNRQFSQSAPAAAQGQADPWEQLNQQFAMPAVSAQQPAQPQQQSQRAEMPMGSVVPTPRVPDGTPLRDLGGNARLPADLHPAAPEKKSFFDGIGSPSEWARQTGLTARHGLEGLGQASQLVTEPLRQYVVNPAANLLGLPPAAASGSTMSSLADTLGLPEPQNRQERIVGDAARLMAGSGGMMGLLGAATGGAQVAGGLLPTASTTGLGQSTMAGLAANPGTQLGSAAGAGMLGGTARENGAGALGQFGASLLGGLGGAGAVAATNSLSNLARNAASRMTSRPADLDIRFTKLMDEAGVDMSTLPKEVARGLRAEMETALRTGRELRPDAIRRLADFRAVGATPTRGSITLDPVQLTREQNLAKIAANSSDDQLAALPRMQNENNARLISRLNESGAARAPEAIEAGEAAIGALGRNLDAQRGNVNALYSNARDSAGRSFPLDGAVFTNRAAQALDDRLLGGALPADVRNHLNRIASGEVPFTVDYAEQLKTAMGNLQRASSDGQVRMALGVVRNELDNTPVLGLGQQTGATGARAVNPGNLPAVPGAPQLGEEAIAAFNQARAANRSMMQSVEASPALKAVFEGTATPDQFVNKFILGSGASAADVAALRRGLGDNQYAIGAVRDHLVDYLKGKALNGAADEVGKFSAAAYNKALNAIGNRKLAQFFKPEEIAQLRAVGRVGSYMQAQPVGAAVNNSNSGALLAGRGYDLLKGVLGKIPFGESALLTPLRNIEISMRQRGAQNLLPGLLAEEMKRQGAVSAPFLLPGSAAAGGLLATPGVNGP